MGQSPSIASSSSYRLSLPTATSDSEEESFSSTTGRDHTVDIPDDCLALIFQFLSSADRNHCSLVCKRWLLVDGQTRQRLSISARSDLLPLLPSIFSRFNSITKLALRCDRKSSSLDDAALALISKRCRNLTRLKLRGCREITELGMAELAANCRNLKRLSCGSCSFGAKGIYEVINRCASLEEVTIKRLRSPRHERSNPLGAVEGVEVSSSSSLKSICLKELVNGQLFEALVIGSNKLQTLKIIKCLGDWDRVLEEIGNGHGRCLVEVHLEKIQVCDIGLMGISRCSNIEVLQIIKDPECSNLGLVSVAENCGKLRKLHIDGWMTNRIGDEGLLAVAKGCSNLEELVLIGVNATHLSLGPIAENCQKLERLALCGSETIGDEEIVCVAEKCTSLKKLCIKGCVISDAGIAVLAWGFPKLVKVKIKKCKSVTSEALDRLQEHNTLLTVDFDSSEAEGLDGITSDDVAQEGGLEFRGDSQVVALDGPSSESGRLSFLRAKLGEFASRNLVTCAFSRWSKNEGT